MIKRSNSSSVTFADIWLRHTEKLWNKHWMKKVLERINWNKFSYRMERLYSEDIGRPAWDPIILFRCLLLAQWYNLSDRQLEEAGYEIKEAVSVDATLVEAYSKPRGDNFEGDSEASWRGFPSREINNSQGENNHVKKTRTLRLQGQC